MRARIAVLITSLAIGGLLACAAPVSGGIACQQKINCNASPIWHYYGKTPIENDIYVCVDTTVNFSVSTDQNDNDTCVDDSEICLDGPISYTWSGVTDTHTSSATGSWSQCGDHTVTCTMTDPGSYVKDKEETATWTVHVTAKLDKIAEPVRCVFCVGETYVFTALTTPSGCCTGLTWQVGSHQEVDTCAFAIEMGQAGYYTVTVADKCGGSDSVSFTVTQPCTQSSASNAYCVPHDPVVASLPQPPGLCLYGATGLGDYGPISHVCFDCSSKNWRVHTTDWPLNVLVVIDPFAGSTSKQDAGGQIGNCDAAADVYTFWRHCLNNGGYDVCNVTYVPVSCLIEHELVHRQQWCAKWTELANAGLAELNALSLAPYEPYCTAQAAQEQLGPQGQEILDRMVVEWNSWSAEHAAYLENEANQAMAACCRTLLGQICEPISSWCLVCTLLE